MRTIVIAAIITAFGARARAESALPLAPAGITVQLGGGVTGFARQEARELFRTGGYWDLRAVWGSDSVLGAELAYRASTNNGRAGRMGDAQLLGDGAEAAARINMPLRLEGLRLTPFAFVGAGWTYYQVIQAPARAFRDDHASLLVLPFGAGFSGTIEHVVVDARITYRGAHAGQLVAAGDQVALQSWSAGLTVGYEL